MQVRETLMTDRERLHRLVVLAMPDDAVCRRLTTVRGAGRRHVVGLGFRPMVAVARMLTTALLGLGRPHAEDEHLQGICDAIPMRVSDRPQWWKVLSSQHSSATSRRGTGTFGHITRWIAAPPASSRSMRTPSSARRCRSGMAQTPPRQPDRQHRIVGRSAFGPMAPPADGSRPWPPSFPDVTMASRQGRSRRLRARWWPALRSWPA